MKALYALLVPCLAPMAAAAAAPSFAAAPATSPAAGELDRLWYDGQAELCGYEWKGVRYGEERSGEAVAIFVTEPFGEVSHVKVDDPRAGGEPVTTALKLNLVRDFQTGVYDYNTMSSVFVRASDQRLMKSTFSSAEWCGHVFEEVDVRPEQDLTGITTLSYFQGESGSVRLAHEPDGVVGDQLLVWARGLAGAPLGPGESVRMPFLPSSFQRRMRHQPAEWAAATVERAGRPQPVEVPAGTFEAYAYEIRVPGASGGALTGTVHVEAAVPHRLLAWAWTSGGSTLDSGELTGSQRMKYWQLHREGDQSLRRELGLAVD